MAAIQLVRNHGSPVQKARLAFALGESSETRVVEEYLEELQLPNGGFPFQGKMENPYCLSNVNMMMKIMSDLRLQDIPVCQKTVRFVKKIQHPDGHWEENEDLKALNPPFWDRPGDLNTSLWLTGAIADSLTRLGHGESYKVRKAAEFLLKHRKPNGAFEGFRHTTWLAIAVLTPLKGLDHVVVREALNSLGAIGDWEATDLNWVLDCLFWAGIPKDHQLVKLFLEKMLSFQRPDGQWKSADDPADPVVQTLECLITFKNYQQF